MKPSSPIEWGNFVLLATDDAGVRGRSTPIFGRPCADLCASVFDDPAQQYVCHYLCEEIEAQAGEPCIQAFANSTDEHLSLLSYSSGHYMETARIVAGAAFQQSEDLEFVQQLHLNDRGSPTGCHAIDDAHYCHLKASGTLLDNQEKLHAEQCTQNRFVDDGAVPQTAHSQSKWNSRGLLAASSTLRGQANTRGHEEQHHKENGVDLDAVMGIVGKLGHDDSGCEENDSVHSASLVEGNCSSADEDGEVLRSSEQSVRDPLLGTTSPSRASSILRQRSWVKWTARKEGSPSSLWVQFLKCFSLRKNVRKLLAPPRSSNRFGALDGIRTLSNMWIILFHTMVIQLQAGGGISNMIDVLPIDGHGVLARKLNGVRTDGRRDVPRSRAAVPKAAIAGGRSQDRGGTLAAWHSIFRVVSAVAGPWHS